MTEADYLRVEPISSVRSRALSAYTISPLSRETFASRIRAMPFVLENFATAAFTMSVAAFAFGSICLA